jgi:hypothetical protein
MESKRSELQQRAIEVITPLIPADAEERVARAHREFRQIVRSSIRAETRLALGDEETRDVVPVRVVDGFSDPIASLILKFEDPTLWRLLLALPRLGGVVEGLQGLLAHWYEYERWQHLPPVARGAQDSLERARDVASALQHLAVKERVFEELRMIDTDILGVYRYQERGGSQIELYWMAHALFAGAFGVRIEDLTVVTLAHELAHAYTHLGRDIDGKVWETGGFGASELEVVEGLAQFYTHEVAKRIESRAPGVIIAFERLLGFQAAPYRAHQGWAASVGGRVGEAVRFAMLQTRRRGRVMNSDWRSALEQAARALHGHPGGPTQKRLNGPEELFGA